MPIILIETTFESEKDACHIAQKLIEKKLAACCHILPKVRSFFFWEGSLEQKEETVLRIKTVIDKKETVVQFLSENHPYSVPECVCFVGEANTPYQSWIDHELH